MEIINSLRFFVDYMRGKPNTSSKSTREGGKVSFGDAFGISRTSKEPTPVQPMVPPEASTEDANLLGPYPFASTHEHGNV